MIFFNLRVLMAERGLTISKIHRDTGINRVTLTAINNNTNQSISLNIVNTLCNYLKITPNQLFTYIPFEIKIINSKIVCDNSYPTTDEFDEEYKNLICYEIKYFYQYKIYEISLYFNYDFDKTNIFFYNPNVKTGDYSHFIGVINSLPLQFISYIKSSFLNSYKEAFVDFEFEITHEYNGVDTNTISNIEIDFQQQK